MKTKHLKPCVAIAFLILATAVNSAFAQHSHKELQLGLSYTLSLGGVYEQLEMDQNQRYALDDLWLMTELGLKSEIQKFQASYSETLPESEIALLKSEFQKEVQKIRDNESERINSVLSGKQVDRLKQIRFQFLSRNGDGMTGIKDVLGLSDGQIRKIEDLKTSAQTKVSKMNHESRELKIPQADIASHLQQIRKVFEEDLIGILTTSQKQKLKSLQGEEFEFQYGPKKVDESEQETTEAIQK